MKKLIYILLFILFSKNTFALAEGVYTVIIQKQKEKESSRWSLADWFATQKKIALMDQWLALNSSTNWFEFIFDYSKGDLDETFNEDTNKKSQDINRLGAALYIKFLGFEYNDYDYSLLVKQSDFRLNLLILGSSVQSTHLRAFYGRRNFRYDNYSSYKQNFGGAALTFYLTSFIGGEFIYTNFYKTKSDNKVYTMHGQRKEYGAFLELSFLRLYFNKFIEKSTYNSLSRTTKVDDGVILGAKIFL